MVANIYNRGTYQLFSFPHSKLFILGYWSSIFFCKVHVWNMAFLLGLSSLLHSKTYTDAFILHERSSLDKAFPLKKSGIGAPFCMKKTLKKDRRKNLNDRWLKLFKFQPLWKIRNYFGEKIGLYFAWLGKLCSWT